MMRLILLSIVLVLSLPADAREGWFCDVGIAFNADSGEDSERDFEGGKEIAMLGCGHYFEKPVDIYGLTLSDFEVGGYHLSHYLRGWPGDKWFGWDGHEEEVNMFYFKKRFWW